MRTTALSIALAATMNTLIASPVLADQSAFIEFDDPALKAGRTVWMGTCMGCHGYGVGGAPIPMKPEQWRPRLQQGRDTLYQHAINGFFGPDYAEMPPRGGNPNLSDDEVRSAVDYMATLAEHYASQ